MIHGIINVYKEKGYTSHDVVARLRGILKQKKIGHTGTLDPDAEGVLPICLGKATKVCDLLTDKDKIYETILLLGKSTDTQDISGKVLNKKEVECSIKEAYEVIQGFKGKGEQIPPMYSALKVDGKRLYKLAREGKTVERKPRPITIHDIMIREVLLPRISMTVHCSKGTYIRTLCHDIGEKLICGGCMEQLLRTKVDRFVIEDSLRLEQIEILSDIGQLQEHIMPIETVFSEYAKVKVKGEFTNLLDNGNTLFDRHIEQPEDLGDYGLVRVCDDTGEFRAVYEYNKRENRFKMVKNFSTTK